MVEITECNLFVLTNDFSTGPHVTENQLHELNFFPNVHSRPRTLKMMEINALAYVTLSNNCVLSLLDLNYRAQQL